MKIFLDVGSHQGQTLCAVLPWAFDRIVCFEPVAQHWPKLHQLADARVTVEPFGLWNQTATAPLYDTGGQGASLWERPNRSKKSSVCEFVRASDWVRANIPAGATTWAKINVEGAELDVLTDLLDSGEFSRIDYLQVMWDAQKIPAVASRLAAVQERLAALNFDPLRVIGSKDPRLAGRTAERMNAWLTLTGC